LTWEPRRRVSLYYVMVLAWVGCVADTAEVAAWFGDDIAFRGDSYRVDLAGLPLMGFALSHAGAGTPFLHRLRLAANLVLTGGRAVERGLMAHCLTTAQMAGRLGLASEVCDPLRQVFTRWDAGLSASRIQWQGLARAVTSGQSEDDGVQGQPHGRPHYRAVDADVLQIAP
jgi:hypothetical protein